MYHSLVMLANLVAVAILTPWCTVYKVLIDMKIVDDVYGVTYGCYELRKATILQRICMHVYPRLNT